jgi:hypothetical protein
MARFSLREAVFSVMHDRLEAAFPDFSGFRAIERNPMNEIPSDYEFPCLRTVDGDHAVVGSDLLGEITYQMDWFVTGAVQASAASEAGDLDAEMNDLQARIIEAVTTDGSLISVPLTDGWLEIRSDEGQFSLNRQGVQDSEFPSITFTQGIALTVEVHRGTAFVEPA